MLHLFGWDNPELPSLTFVLAADDETLQRILRVLCRWETSRLPGVLPGQSWTFNGIYGLVGPRIVGCEKLMGSPGSWSSTWNSSSDKTCWWSGEQDGRRSKIDWRSCWKVTEGFRFSTFIKNVFKPKIAEPRGGNSQLDTGRHQCWVAKNESLKVHFKPETNFSSQKSYKCDRIIAFWGNA